jgi:hypothetical protein
MPCTGPMMPGDEEVDRVTDEVMQFLKEKHGIHSVSEKFFTCSTEENHLKDRAKMREVIKSLLHLRNCEEF